MLRRRLLLVALVIVALAPAACADATAPKQDGPGDSGKPCSTTQGSQIC